MLGHSGARVDYIGGLVVKSARGPTARRLKLQADKQAAFRSSVVGAVPIIARLKVGSIYAFVMRRFAQDYGRTLHAVHKLIEFVDSNLGAPVHVPAATLRAKVHDVKRSITANRFAAHSVKPFGYYCDHLLDRFASGATCPSGYSHGDLTLCNVLNNGDRVLLIDFLDTFVDTPLLDVVKLRQDTHRRWVQRFASIDTALLSQADRMLDNRFGAEAWFAEWYRPFEMLNALRVVPYARDERTVQWALSVLRTP